MKTPMPFAGNSKMMMSNGTMLDLNSTFVTDGTLPVGSMWQMNPIPTTRDGPSLGKVGYTFPPPCYDPTPPRALSQGRCTGEWINNITMSVCFFFCEKTTESDKMSAHCHAGICVQYNSSRVHEVTTCAAIPSVYVHLLTYALNIVNVIIYIYIYINILFKSMNGFNNQPINQPINQPTNKTRYDQLLVPTVAAGEYVLGFRWDAEGSAQVWQACADVTIVE